MRNVLRRTLALILAFGIGVGIHFLFQLLLRTPDNPITEVPSRTAKNRSDEILRILLAEGLDEEKLNLFDSWEVLPVLRAAQAKDPTICELLFFSSS